MLKNCSLFYDAHTIILAQTWMQITNYQNNSEVMQILLLGMSHKRSIIKCALIARQ
jgi:hypothetical protein